MNAQIVFKLFHKTVRLNVKGKPSPSLRDRTVITNRKGRHCFQKRLSVCLST